MSRPLLVLSTIAMFALLVAADPSEDSSKGVELPQGQDIELLAGFTYSVTASVSKDFSKADILAKAPEGVEVLEFREQGPGLGPDPNPDHRYVFGKFVVHQNAGTLPWKSPWPTTIFSLVKASSMRGSEQISPTTPGGPSRRWIVGGLVGAAALGCFVWFFWRWKRRARAARVSRAPLEHHGEHARQ